MTFSSENRIVFCTQGGAEDARAFFASGPTCGELCATEAAVITATRHQDMRRSVFKRLTIIVSRKGPSMCRVMRLLKSQCFAFLEGAQSLALRKIQQIQRALEGVEKSVLLKG